MTARPPSPPSPLGLVLRAGVLCVGALCLVTASGCDATLTTAGTPTLTYTEDARKAYEEALASFQEKDWESARALFGEVKKLFPQSRYARLAELRLADIDFAQEKYTEAIGSYRTFVTGHRHDREVEYARYRLSKALYFDVDDTIFLPPAEERDQSTAAEAHRELTSFLKQYPRSRYRRDVDYMLDVVTGRLVRHELYVARYYRQRDNFEAALARIDFALGKFPSSGLDAEALVLRGETLLMMDRRPEAKVVFERVVTEFGAPFKEAAQRFLDEIAAPSQTPPSIRRDLDTRRDPGALAPESKTPAAPASPLPAGVDVKVRSGPEPPP